MIELVATMPDDANLNVSWRDVSTMHPLDMEALFTALNDRRRAVRASRRSRR